MEEKIYNKVAAEVFALNYQLSELIKVWSKSQQSNQTFSLDSIPQEIIDVMQKIDARMLVIGKSPKFSAFVKALPYKNDGHI